MSFNNPEIHMDEHDRSCLWSARHYPDRCERGKALVEALEWQSENRAPKAYLVDSDESWQASEALLRK